MCAGELERAVVPEESVWTLEVAGDADNGGSGLVLTLVKMNLELFANSAEHHVVWWPKLFRCAPAHGSRRRGRRRGAHGRRDLIKSG